MSNLDSAATLAGEKITISNGRLSVPSNPVIPFIRGDGTGPDIWAASVRVMDAAVEKAYGGEKKISWHEVFAGQAAKDRFDNWLPDETVEAFRDYLVGIKGPLTTPVGGGIRSLNVALRQMLDLYVCLRPVQYFTGVPSPVKRPEKVDMVIFRENTEDIYAGIEYKAGSPDAQKVLEFLAREFPADFKKIRFGTTMATAEYVHGLDVSSKMDEATGAADAQLEVGVGIKPVSRVGTQRLVQAAIEYAVAQKRKSVTLVHKGNIMKYTEGAFRDWGYQLADTMFGAQTYSWARWEKTKAASGEAAANDEMKAASSAGKVIVKDAIADITLQQVLTRPEDFDVIATLNLNGDYLSDALAAQVGGIGIAPGGNVNYRTGHAIFEATHGTAPKYADLDKVNPGSVILSGEMMFRYLGWTEAADLILKGLNGAIASKRVTYDFARLMDGATEVKCSEFGDGVIAAMLRGGMWDVRRDVGCGMCGGMWDVKGVVSGGRGVVEGAMRYDLDGKEDAGEDWVMREDGPEGGKNVWELKVYALAHELGVESHRLSLRLPKHEMYETGSQLRRAAKSVSANIVEGYGRRRYKAEFLRFLVFAKSSLSETEEHLHYVCDCHPEHQTEALALLATADALGRRLHRFMLGVENNHRT